MTTSRPSRSGATASAASAPPVPTTAASSASSADPSTDPRQWKALGVLAAGLALIVIDGSIVAVSLPTSIGDLGLDLTDAQWSPPAMPWSSPPC